MTSEEVQQVPSTVHIPETIGSVVPAYNLPVEGLKLTPWLDVYNIATLPSI